MSYSPFPIEPVAVSDLRLDLANYRIEGNAPSESAAITYLFAEHDVESLARQILLETYVDLEVPLVVRENGEFVVLEGNRRVTALKTLLNPDLAPPAVRSRLERLLIQYALEAESLPRAIRVMVAPRREDTAVLQARLHIGRSKKGWGRAEQSRFVIAQLDAGRTIKELKRELPGIKNPVAYVRQHYITHLLRDTSYTDPRVAAYATSKLPLTAFEYAYGNAEIQRVIGLEFDDDGVPRTTPTTPEEVAAFERLVTMYYDGDLSSRKFPKRSSKTFDADMSDVLARLVGTEPADAAASDPAPVPTLFDPPAQTPSTPAEPYPSVPLSVDPDGSSAPPVVPEATPHSVAGAGVPHNGGADAPTSPNAYTGTPPAPGVPRPNAPSTRKQLLITVDYSWGSTGIHERFSELRKLSVGDTPIATAVLIRSIVEASVKFHFSRLATSQNVSGELGPVMQVVRQNYGNERSLKNVIELLNDKSASPLRPGSLRWFNNATHDADFAVLEPDVRAAWQQVEPLIQFMLKRPTHPTV